MKRYKLKRNELDQDMIEAYLVDDEDMCDRHFLAFVLHVDMLPDKQFDGMLNDEDSSVDIRFTLIEE